MVFVLGDLFQDHLSFSVKFRFIQFRPHHVGQQIDQAILKLWQHGRVINRLFFGRVGVALASKFVQLAIDVFGRSSVRAFEHHVFQEMAQPRFGVHFVARSGTYEITKGSRVAARVNFGRDSQTTGQSCVSKFRHVVLLRDLISFQFAGP